MIGDSQALHPMRLRPIALLILLFLAALFLLRETRDGFLRPVEGWIVERLTGTLSAKPDAPTLVLQGGAEGAELDGLDIGLFTRAAALLGAQVAGIAAYQVPASAFFPGPPTTPTTKFLCGNILVSSGKTGGAPPVIVNDESEPMPGKLERFAGSYSEFAGTDGWLSGFLNLPSGPDSEDKLVVIARSGEQIAGSFALSALSLAMGNGGFTLRKGVLHSGGRVIPLDSRGRISIAADTIRQLNRVDMDDLLLAAERLEQGREQDAGLIDLIRGRIVLFGTLSGTSSGDIRLDTGRRLSLVEYQGMAITALLSELRPATLAFWREVALLALFCFAPLFLRNLSARTAFLAAAGLCVFWLLGVAGIFLFSGVVPPILPVCFLLFTAWIFRMEFRRPPEVAAR